MKMYALFRFDHNNFVKRYETSRRDIERFINRLYYFCSHVMFYDSDSTVKPTVILLYQSRMCIIGWIYYCNV